MIHTFFREDFFDQNLALFAELNPEAALQIELMLDKFELEPCLTEKLEPNLKKSRFGLTDYYHAPTGALDEMHQAIPESLLARSNIIYFYGIGLGYGYEALKPWLKTKPEHRVVFLEDNLEVLYYFFHTEMATQFLQDSQVTLFYFQNYEIDADKFYQLHSNFLGRRLDFFVLPYYNMRRQQEAFNLCYLLLHTFALTNEIHGEYMTGQAGFLKNFYPNLLKLPESYLAHYLFNEFKGVPAIICGAGPSLKKNIHLLKTLSSHALIFAGGSALNVINEEQIIPHFGLGVDPNPEQIHRLLTNHTFHLPYLYRQRVNHEAIDLIPGPKIYISGSDNRLSKWFEKELKIDIPLIDEGHNVVNFCTEIAYRMGCDPIIYVGLDLAYLPKDDDVETYAKGIQMHPLWIEKSHPYQVNPNERLVNRIDITGKKVQTRWDWLSESLWISHFAEIHSNTRFINATEGGIGFATIPNKTLAEVREHYLTHVYDLDNWVHLAIQKAPKAATQEQIIALMQKIQASLHYSLLICKEILVEKGQQSQTPHSLPLNFYTHQTTLAEHELEKEVIYENFLKIFNLNYNYLNRAKKLLSTHSSDAFITQLGRINFLHQVLYQHLQLLVSSVKQSLNHAPSLPLPKQTSIKKSPKKEDYFFKNTHLKIEDLTLDLAIDESFDPYLPQEQVKIYYPESTQLKQSSFYLEGQLHGPSYFYSPQGVLLTESWFQRGKKQGRWSRYYLSGALYCLLGYRENLLEGKQEYFYEDGYPYVIMHYKKGLLEGPVSIYYPHGPLKRELHYQEGKRHGLERLWNAQEKLIMECEYSFGIPIKTAKEWNLNGQLIKQVDIYDFPENFDLSLWKPTGEKFKYYKNGIEDFTDVYEKTQEQVKIMEAGIENVMQKMDNLIKERADQLKETYPQLDQEFASLQQALKEMDRLKMHMLDQMNAHIQEDEKARQEHLIKLKQKKEQSESL
jgi:antitoxin component YwqK of YwqJK toxin-antitoxin module